MHMVLMALSHVSVTVDFSYLDSLSPRLFISLNNRCKCPRFLVWYEPLIHPSYGSGVEH